MRPACMLVLLYEQVRSIFAGNSFSRAQQACQGTSAGRAHATAMLMAPPLAQHQVDHCCCEGRETWPMTWP
eukprot:2433478-Pyramimonas_sp.AAC.1